MSVDNRVYNGAVVFTINLASDDIHFKEFLFCSVFTNAYTEHNVFLH